MPTASPALAHFVFVIGSTDDFESANDLRIAAEERAIGNTVDLNFSRHRFSVPSTLDEDTIILIGRGLAFSNGWCEDDTISFLMFDLGDPVDASCDIW